MHNENILIWFDIYFQTRSLTAVMLACRLGGRPLTLNLALARRASHFQQREDVVTGKYDLIGNNLNSRDFALLTPISMH